MVPIIFTFKTENAKKPNIQYFKRKLSNPKTEDNV